MTLRFTNVGPKRILRITIILGVIVFVGYLAVNSRSARNGQSAEHELTQRDGLPDTPSVSGFGEVAPSQLETFNLDDVVVSYFGGAIAEVTQINIVGRRHGWSLVYDFGGKSLLAAQQFHEGTPHGGQFFWAGLGGGLPNTPYSFGVWEKGKPLRGIFRPAGDTAVMLDEDRGYLLGDNGPPPTMVLLDGEGGRQDVTFDDYVSTDRIRADRDILRSFQELRAVAEYCCNLEVRKPGQ